MPQLTTDAAVLDYERRRRQVLALFDARKHGVRTRASEQLQMPLAYISSLLTGERRHERNLERLAEWVQGTDWPVRAAA